MTINTADEIIVRKMVSSDLDVVLKLVSQIQSEENLLESAHAQFCRELSQPINGEVRYVAAIRDSVVGTMGCGVGPIPSPHVLWADWLIVDHNRRRGGIASRLYAAIEEHALALRKKYLCLDIGNIDRERAAYVFHLKNGFQIVGQIPDYWGELEHLNIMAKPLNLQR